MIKLTKLDGKIFYINSLKIETIEATPDTVITFTGGKKVIVKENADLIVEKIQANRRSFLRMLES